MQQITHDNERPLPPTGQVQDSQAVSLSEASAASRTGGASTQTQGQQTPASGLSAHANQASVRTQVAARGKLVGPVQPPVNGHTNLQHVRGTGVQSSSGGRPAQAGSIPPASQPTYLGPAHARAASQQATKAISRGSQVQGGQWNRQHSVGNSSRPMLQQSGPALKILPKAGMQAARPLSPAVRSQGYIQAVPKGSQQLGRSNQQARQPTTVQPQQQSQAGNQPFRAANNQQVRPAVRPAQLSSQFSTGSTPRSSHPSPRHTSPGSSSQPAHQASSNASQPPQQPSPMQMQLNHHSPVGQASSPASQVSCKSSGLTASQRTGPMAAVSDPKVGQYPRGAAGVTIAAQQPSNGQFGGPRSPHLASAHINQQYPQISRVAAVPSSPQVHSRAHQGSTGLCQSSPKEEGYPKPSPRQGQSSARNRKASIHQQVQVQQQSSPPLLQLPPPQQRLQGQQQGSQAFNRHQGGHLNGGVLRQTQMQLTRHPPHQEAMHSQNQPGISSANAVIAQSPSLQMPLSSAGTILPATGPLPVLESTQDKVMPGSALPQRSASGVKRGPSPGSLQKTLSAPHQRMLSQATAKSNGPSSQKAPASKLQKTMSGPIQRTPALGAVKVKLESKSAKATEAQGFGKEKQGEGQCEKSSPGRKISCEDIQLVQNLIERCLQLYMNQKEVITTLQYQAKIEPGFTSLVWQKLEEQNPEFFKAYYVRLKVKDQIMLFNHLLDQHVNTMQKMRPQPQVFPKPGPVPAPPSTALPQILPRPRLGEVPVHPMAPPPYAMPLPRPPAAGLAVPTHHSHLQPMPPPPPPIPGPPPALPMAPPLPPTYAPRPGMELAATTSTAPPQTQPLPPVPQREAPGPATQPLPTSSEAFPFASIGMAPPADIPMEPTFATAEHASTASAGDSDPSADPAAAGLCTLPTTDAEESLKNTESLGRLGNLPRNFSLSDLTAELNSHMEHGGVLSGDTAGLLGLGDSPPLGLTSPLHALTSETESFLRSPNRQLDDEGLLASMGDALDFDKLK